jgi:hypothetical protein
VKRDCSAEHQTTRQPGTRLQIFLLSAQLQVKPRHSTHQRMESEDEEAPPLLVASGDVASADGGLSDQIEDLNLVKVPITIVTGGHMLFLT